MPGAFSVVYVQNISLFSEGKCSKQIRKLTVCELLRSM